MTSETILKMEEGQTFERKSIHISPKALAIPLVAFANADGGMIAIGISDKTQRIEGVDQETKKVNDLLRVPFDFCFPTIKVEIERISCTDSQGEANHILLMHVEPSAEMHANQADEVFMRVGDKSKKLSFEERTRLMYDKGERFFEDKLVPDADIQDLDLEFVETYIKKIGYTKTVMEFLLENKGFIKERNGELQVSSAAILLFGKNPQLYFPRARVRFIRYDGTEEKSGTEMNVIKDVVFEGTILNMITASIAYLDTQIKERTYLGTEGRFVIKEEYPRFVRQEMIVNAVTHRDYSIRGTDIQIKMFDDRIVVESPGRLPGLVRSDNIRHTHFSRNPKIAEFLKAYNFVKEYGEGVDRICKELEAAGLALPEYHTDTFILRMVVHNHVLKNPPDNGRTDFLVDTNAAIKIGDKNTAIKSAIKYGDKKAVTHTNDAHKTAGRDVILVEVHEWDETTQRTTTKRVLEYYRQILGYMQPDIEYTARDMENLLNLKSTRTNELLRNLVRAGKLTEFGGRKNRRYKKVI